MALLLNAGARARLRPPPPGSEEAGAAGAADIAEFELAAAELRALWVANLGGRAMASAAAVAASGVSVAAGPAPPACLAWCPHPAPGWQGAPPGLSYLAVTRPVQVRLAAADGVGCTAGCDLLTWWRGEFKRQSSPQTLKPYNHESRIRNAQIFVGFQGDCNMVVMFSSN